jgi:hypothetical protein
MGSNEVNLFSVKIFYLFQQDGYTRAKGMSRQKHPGDEFLD